MSKKIHSAFICSQCSYETSKWLGKCPECSHWNSFQEEKSTKRIITTKQDPQKIREIERVQGREKAIPIIAMTASLLKTEIDSCYNAGMNNYIPKPYKLEELIVPIFKELRS